jgi:hypothetical protein
MPKQIRKATVKIMDTDKINFDYGIYQRDFMKDVMKTIVHQDDFRGIGGHGFENHGPHGYHTQISIGLDNKTINFRELK